MLFGERNFSGVGNEQFFLLLGGILPPSIGFHPNCIGLGEGVGQSIYSGANKPDESRWNNFDKMGNTGGIIQGDNSAGHCFILRYLGSIDKKL